MKPLRQTSLVTCFRHRQILPQFPRFIGSLTNERNPRIDICRKQILTSLLTGINKSWVMYHPMEYTRNRISAFRNISKEIGRNKSMYASEFAESALSKIFPILSDVCVKKVLTVWSDGWFCFIYYEKLFVKRIRNCFCIHQTMSLWGYLDVRQAIGGVKKYFFKIFFRLVKN